MERAWLCPCVRYAVKYSFQLEFICAWGKATRDYVYMCQEAPRWIKI